MYPLPMQAASIFMSIKCRFNCHVGDVARPHQQKVVVGYGMPLHAVALRNERLFPDAVVYCKHVYLSQPAEFQGLAGSTCQDV